MGFKHLRWAEWSKLGCADSLENQERGNSVRVDGELLEVSSKLNRVSVREGREFAVRKIPDATSDEGSKCQVPSQGRWAGG